MDPLIGTGIRIGQHVFLPEVGMVINPPDLKGGLIWAQPRGRRSGAQARHFVCFFGGGVGGKGAATAGSRACPSTSSATRRVGLLRGGGKWGVGEGGSAGEGIVVVCFFRPLFLASASFCISSFFFCGIRPFGDEKGDLFPEFPIRKFVHILTNPL